MEEKEIIEFLKGIIDAINWEVQVMNGTMDFLNEGKVRIDKEDFNQKILALGEGIEAKDDEKMAAAVKALIPKFEELGQAAQEVIA